MKSTVNEAFVSAHTCRSHGRGIRDAMYVLNGKWKLPLIFTLRESPMRFNEILKAIEGITPKVLANELRELELNGLIEKKTLSTTPATILYEATPYSDTLRTVLYELAQWGDQHREKVKQGLRSHY